MFWVLLWMGQLAPGRDHRVLGHAIVDAIHDRGALVAGGDEHTAALLVAVAFRESAFRLDAVGAAGEVCAFQILGGSRALLSDAPACTAAAYAHLRASLSACASLPALDRLAVYARGRCDSSAGVRISRDRFALAGRILQ